MKITADHMQSMVTLIGRVLISLIFIIAGFNKILNFSEAVAYISSQGLEYANLIAFLAIIFELGGGLMILLGWKARIGAAMLFIFTLPVTFIFHSFWSVEPTMVNNQMQHFMKNFAIIGATLYLMVYGAGGFSFDAKKGSSMH